METCTLPIHVRLIYCNLSKASVTVLANSLLTNTSLVGFTCLFPDTNDAAQSLKNVVIKTLAPLQIWDNQELPDHIILLREKLKLRALLCSLPFTDGPAKYLPLEIIRKFLLCIEESSDSESCDDSHSSQPSDIESAVPDQ